MIQFGAYMSVFSKSTKPNSVNPLGMEEHGKSKFIPNDLADGHNYYVGTLMTFDSVEQDELLRQELLQKHSGSDVKILSPVANPEEAREQQSDFLKGDPTALEGVVSGVVILNRLGGYYEELNKRFKAL